MINPTAVFKPLEWQIPAWRDQSPVLLLTGSAGGGKSRLAAEKVHGYCKRYAGATALIVRKAREWTRTSVVPFFKDTVVGDDPAVNFIKSEYKFEYTNGSAVYVGGMKDDMQREAIRSIGGDGGIDIAWMEEANAFTRKDFDELGGRLRGKVASWRQLILTTNPGGSSHWIKRDLIDGKAASSYYSGYRDNLHNPEDYAARLASMKGVMYKRLVLGQWVQAEGAVYDGFDHETHVISRSRSEFGRWALGVDEGYTNPAVILDVGIDADGRLHIFSEWYERGKLQATIVKEAKRLHRKYPRETVAVDAAAAGLIADMRNNEIPARPSKGRVLDGIQTVQNKLAVAGDGRPRLTIDPSCVNTISEFESYIWKATKDGGTRDEPTKEHDHAMDALRYLCNFYPERDTTMTANRNPFYE